MRAEDGAYPLGVRWWRVENSVVARRSACMFSKDSPWVTSRRKCRQSISIEFNYGLLVGR
jgi:hypothetical protein